jgi:thioredoxin reductase (NADPH)
MRDPVKDTFPTLTASQASRIAKVGRARDVAIGEVLVSPDLPRSSFFLVERGTLEIGQGLVSLGPGQFTGELSTVTGRRGLVEIRATAPGRVIEVDSQALRALVDTDSELGEILLRAFILRRANLIELGAGDAILVGSSRDHGTLQAMEFLTRNGYPYRHVDLDAEPEIHRVLEGFHVDAGDIPVLVAHGQVLRRPRNAQIAELLGLNRPLDEGRVHDLVVVGAGPAGLAAAVYAGSEGLTTLVLEQVVPGGQAGSSSKIENYLGFPNGISGGELTARAHVQAEKFGVQVRVADGAVRLRCDEQPYAIALDDGRIVRTRAVVIATGAAYRKLAIHDLARFENVGVYYGATHLESQRCRDQDVIVVGGGNSAGQAAVFLAQTARHVDLLVRASGLAASMSQYLIRRIEQSPNITLHTRCEIVALEGGDTLTGVRWRDGRGGVETREIRHVFSMTGAVPATRWLEGCLALDDHGFVRTGPDLRREDLAAYRWPLARPPHLLETSIPRVFAVGDARAGSVKRVATAVGEGASVIALVHRVLAE